jgi:alpha-tubulin suppressor-like RCC1 family protein
MLGVIEERWMHGDEAGAFVLRPSRVLVESRLKHVAVGGIHAAAVSEEGHLFTWGCGSDGRLGLPGAEKHRYLFRASTPQRVPLLEGVRAVSASYYTTAAIVDCRGLDSERECPAERTGE